MIKERNNSEESLLDQLNKIDTMLNKFMKQHLIAIKFLHRIKKHHRHIYYEHITKEEERKLFE